MTAKGIALLHYASPPVVGGVEATLLHQAQGLADLSYSVRVISGSGAGFDPRIKTIIDPLFGSADRRILALKRDLDRGGVPGAFLPLVDEIAGRLRAALAGVEACIVHNIHTMNKNLALTAALHRLAPPMIAWCHDLAWTNPLYLPELHDGDPWNLLRQPWAKVRYVTISQARQTELAALLEVAPGSIAVVPPGVDLARFSHWTETMARIVERLRLLDADLLLLLPARLTRRKNIALAIRVTAALRALSGLDCRLIVTGPPGPHNPANPGYLGELLDLRAALGVQDAVHFLYQLSDPPLIPDDATMANLYHLVDGLLFPSVQEGFGIPILEAGSVGLPVFCADLPVFHETGAADVTYFDPLHDPPEAIAATIHAYYADNPRHRLRVRVRHHYRWEAIIREQLVPMLEVL